MTNHFALKALNENQEILMLSLLEFHSWRLRVFQVLFICNICIKKCIAYDYI